MPVIGMGKLRLRDLGRYLPKVTLLESSSQDLNPYPLDSKASALSVTRIPRFFVSIFTELVRLFVSRIDQLLHPVDSKTGWMYTLMLAF